MRVSWFQGAAILVATAVSGGALAQPAQTPEGAQQFLGQLAAQGGVTVSTDVGRGWNVFVDTMYDVTYAYDPSLVRSIQSDSACVSAISFARQPDRRGPAASDGMDPVYGYRGEIIYLYWTKVTLVEQTGTAVVVLDPPSYPLRFNFGSEALATRAAYAMEFLRMECDPTAGTGF